MEAQNQTSTFEYVFKKPLPPQMKKFVDMTPEEKEAWSNYFSVWTWRAVESLVDVKDFNPSLRAIAKRLNIRVEEAVDAVEGLEFLKIIKRNPAGGFVRLIKHVDLTLLEMPHREFLKGHLLLTTEMSARIFDYKNIKLVNYVLPSNKETIVAFVTKVNEMLKDLSENSNSQNSDDVFAITCSAAACLSTVRSDLELRAEVNQDE